MGWRGACACDASTAAAGGRPWQVWLASFSVFTLRNSDMMDALRSLSPASPLVSVTGMRVHDDDLRSAASPVEEDRRWSAANPVGDDPLLSGRAAPGDSPAASNMLMRLHVALR